MELTPWIQYVFQYLSHSPTFFSPSILNFFLSTSYYTLTWYTLLVKHVTKEGWRKMIDSRSRWGPKKLKTEAQGEWAGSRRNRQILIPRAGWWEVEKNVNCLHEHFYLENMECIWLWEYKLQEVKPSGLLEKGRSSGRQPRGAPLAVPPQAEPCTLSRERGFKGWAPWVSGFGPSPDP